MSHKRSLEGWPYGPGQPLDVKTFWGNLQGLLFSCGVIYFLWHTYDLLAWGREIFDIAYDIDLAKQRWARLWAVIIGGAGIVNSIIMMVMIPIDRRRARKSAEGQWYDTPLSKRHLGLDDRKRTPDGE